MSHPLKVLSLFSGIGAFEEALKNLKIPFELIHFCEIQPRIAKAYSLIHQVDERLNLGDITQVDVAQLPNFNLLTFGFPCQDISALGLQKGLFDENHQLTRSGLFFEAMKIAKIKQPEYLIAENVRALTFAKRKQDFEQMLQLIQDIGYTPYWTLLNSKDFGIPHSRTRIFIVCIRKDLNQSFEFPMGHPLMVKATDWFESEVEPTYYLEPHHTSAYNDFRLKKGYSTLNASPVIACMTTKQGQKSNPQNFVQDEKGVRILTPREMMRFQGFKPYYGDLLSQVGYTPSQIGYMCGNTITVTVLEAIFQNLLYPLSPPSE